MVILSPSIFVQAPTGSVHSASKSDSIQRSALNRQTLSGSEISSRTALLASSSSRHCTARIPWQAAGKNSCAEKILTANSDKSVCRRSSPAFARKIPSYSPSLSFFKRVSTFPRMGTQAACGSSLFICIILRGLPVPILAPSKSPSPFLVIRQSLSSPAFGIPAMRVPCARA